MRLNIFVILSLLHTVTLGNTLYHNWSEVQDSTDKNNNRVIITTDIGGTDPDDQQSMIHLLLCANDIDIEGIVCQMAFVKSPIGVNVVNDILDSYSQIESNLRIHDSGYPTSEYLRNITKAGQTEVGMLGVGKGKATEGSEMIIKSVDKDDSRPIWLTAWGGMNTIAQALWTVKESRTPEELAKFISKIRIYDILGQCDAGAWIAHTFPDIIYIRAKDVYAWAPDDDWTKEHIQAVGPMGRIYPSRRWATEGDSPSFLYLVNNGLNMPEAIDAGSWGGCFSTVPFKDMQGMDWVKRNNLDELQYSPYYMYSNPEGKQTMIKWSEAIRNDFAARMKWSVSKYSDANHHPQIKFAGEKFFSKYYVSIQAKTGTSIIVDASQSMDPDGDQLKYNLYIYDINNESSSSVTIDNIDNGIFKITFPTSLNVKKFHFILEAVDNGTPSLTSYRRIIVNI